METSLRYDPSRRALCLFAKERFASSDDVILTVRSPSTPLARLVSLEKERESSSRDSPFSSLASSVAAQVSGNLDTRDGRMEGKAHVRKRLFAPSRSTPLLPDRADVGLTYETVRDDVRCGARVRKTVDVSPSGNGTSTLELKAGVSYGMKHQKPEVEGKLELTQKVFNFQEDQDLRLRVGYDLVTRKPYANIRENNWSFKTDFQKSWSVCYDL
jgi:hypothetical protein|tara:strand:- start:240 stop:881 length:642 start_codon:yes stop_codon:yes gene_type:complete